nr:keratin-associated protein 16-1-like [Maniola hyperantus]
MMEYRVIIFAFAALFCQVQSRCFAPDVEVITCPPIVPTTPIVVDNSVSIALANALQLLIVKDIIESNLGASCLPNLLPIETLCGCTEICYPNIGCAPNCYPVTEFIPPCYPGCGVPEVIQPCLPYYNGCPEVISPIYKPGCVEPVPWGWPGCRDIVPPCNPWCSGCDFCGPSPGCIPNCCDTPVAAEVLIPPCIPAQLNCNFGCTPTLGPCINFNVEPLPCGCGYCY